MSKHEMCVMDPTGHTSITWDKDNDNEVELAQEAFDSAIEKGYEAFATKRITGAKGERMKEFDPDAEKMLLFPALKGG